MKTIFLTGRLTSDPEVKKVGDKKDMSLSKFTMANNDSDKENGEFYDVCCWDKLSDFAKEHLKKGNKILLQGTFNNDAYSDKEGKTRVHFQITAQKIEFAG